MSNEEREIDETKLYVGNLSHNIREKDLEDEFSRFGRVKLVRLQIDMATGKSKGYAFVDMEFGGDAKDAVVGMNGKELDGRTVRAEVCKSKPGDIKERTQVVCRNYARGYCVHGKACKFLHDSRGGGGDRYGDRRDNRYRGDRYDDRRGGDARYDGDRRRDDRGGGYGGRYDSNRRDERDSFHDDKRGGGARGRSSSRDRHHDSSKRYDSNRSSNRSRSRSGGRRRSSRSRSADRRRNSNNGNSSSHYYDKYLTNTNSSTANNAMDSSNNNDGGSATGSRRRYASRSRS